MGGMGGERSSAKFGQTGAAEGLSLSDSPFLESPDHAKSFPSTRTLPKVVEVASNCGRTRLIKKRENVYCSD